MTADEINDLTGSTLSGETRWDTTSTGQGWQARVDGVTYRLYISSGGVRFLHARRHGGPSGHERASSWFGLLPRARAIERLTNAVDAQWTGASPAR